MGVESRFEAFEIFCPSAILALMCRAPIFVQVYSSELFPDTVHSAALKACSLVSCKLVAPWSLRIISSGNITQ